MVGGGIVGICTALYLLETGRSVTVVEAQHPGWGASGHNGGAFSIGDCAPIATSGVIRSVPVMLRDPLSPMAIRWPYMPRLTPWLVRFLLASRRAEVDRIASGIAALMGGSMTGYEPLLAISPAAADLLSQQGLLYGYATDAAFAAAREGIRLRERHSTPHAVLDSADLADVDPQLGNRFRHGIYLPSARHTTNPGAFTRALASTFVALGGRLVTETVTAVETRGRRATAVRTSSGRRPVGEVVIAAGAWSRRLARELGASVPLDTERGYGVVLPDPGMTLRFPIISGDHHVALSPEPQGIRIVGTVEFAGLRAPANEERADRLTTAATRIFPGLGTAGSRWWMSYRPSMPDSLPVIGRSPGCDNAYLAFGHGHKGLAQAAITGRLVSELADGDRPSLDLAPYRPDRFRLAGRSHRRVDPQLAGDGAQPLA